MKTYEDTGTISAVVHEVIRAAHCSALTALFMFSFPLSRVRTVKRGVSDDYENEQNTSVKPRDVAEMTLGVSEMVHRHNFINFTVLWLCFAGE